MEANWMANGTNRTALMAAVLLGLVIFGIAYNALVGWLERKGHDRGYTAFLVVGGSLVTLIGGSLVAGISMGLWFTACFAASGLPMTVGSWIRHTVARQAEERKVADVAKELLSHVETKVDGLCDETGDWEGEESEQSGEERAAKVN